MWHARPKFRFPEDELTQQINRRLTLNLLIQGAAAHTFVTASHLVEAELESLRPGLTRMYDCLAICIQLNYCIGDNALMFGWPNRWWGLSGTPQRPFRKHPLMATHGNQLAREAKRYLVARGREKNLATFPGFHWVQFMSLMVKVSMADAVNRSKLEALAVDAVTQIWDIPPERLDAELTQQPAFGNLQQPRSALGRLCRQGVIGYGGVERRDGKFYVVAKAWVFPVLIHELVKGILELICLHSLGALDDRTYRAVIEEADQLEYEAWLLQAGPELWRKFIQIVPRDRPLSKVVMHVARMPPADLESLMLTVIEQPNTAAAILHDTTR